MSSSIKIPSHERPSAVAKARLAPAPPLDSPPLSSGQQRLWFLDQLEPNQPLYNVPTFARIAGPVDPLVLEKALQALIQRHEALRTRFACRDGEPVQLIDSDIRFELTKVDLRNLSEADRSGQVERLAREEARRPFNLATDRLIRATLYELGTADYRLLLVLHHIISDEWSLRIFFRELATSYESLSQRKTADLPELPIQYADYAVWQRGRLGGELISKQLRFWKNALSGSPAVLELPTDRSRGSVPTFRGAEEEFEFGRDLSETVDRFAKSRGVTLYAVLLAAFKALLFRYTGQGDLIVGTPSAGRSRVETENVIGFFVNTLLLRTDVSDNPAFEELLKRVRKVVLDAYSNQDLPFERLVEELQPERSLNHLPFTRLMFVVQNESHQTIKMGNAQVTFMHMGTGTAKFDLTLVVQETCRGLVARAEYNRDLFEPSTITRFLSHFGCLLRGAVERGGQRLSELPLLTESERHQLLFDWNDTATTYPRNQCLHEIFEKVAARTPDAIAACYGAASISYGELNARANQLAHYLRTLNVGPDVPVALAVERSVDMLVGMLGILKAGGAYVPLDPSYPKERLSFMLADAGAPVLLTQQKLFAQLPCQTRSVFCLDSDWELIAGQSRQNPINRTDAEHLAYVIYTSGSTGQPKGVAVPHRGVVRLVLNTNYIRLDANSRVAQVANASFDATTFEVWGALLNGGQVVGIRQETMLSPRLFAKALQERGVTAMFLTTAFFNQMAAEVPGAFEHLQTLIVGGEALDPNWVRAVLKDRPPAQLLNGYGPTENTTFTCCFPIHELADHCANVPIGRPIANTRVYILDRHLNPVPVGVPGELYAGGDGVARGYWNHTELTAQRFITNPFSSLRSAERLYRTGDLARYRSDGTIEYLGRLDGQVKLRGFRIELGEIEAVLGRHPGIRECVVKLQGAAQKRLVAFFVPARDSVPNSSELRAFLGEKLPDYMVPSAFVSLANLPLTRNGKLDRQSLPDFDGARPELDRQYLAARDELELELVRIWEKVLGVSPIGVHDRFFDLGGHSLLAVKVVAQIDKALGKKIRLATLFQTPTIEQLAGVLRNGSSENTAAGGTSVVEIQPKGKCRPLFLVHGAGGGMFWGYVNLSKHLGQDQPVYGFKSKGLDGRKEFTNIVEMASHYVAELRCVQPKGPYQLAGYCFGGVVAFEMARQLAAQGEEVQFLGLLNCSPPNSNYSRIPWNLRWGIRLARNLVYWLRYLSEWSPTQRREFIRWKWSLWKKRFAARGRDKIAQVVAGDLVDLSSYNEEQRSTWEAHIRALLSYRPQTYPGRVHLFRSRGHPLWCSFEPDYGWSEFALGGVDITLVPGAHEKILEEPLVEELAGKLGECLAQVHEEPPPQELKSASENLNGVQEPSEPGSAENSGAPGTRRHAAHESRSSSTDSGAQSGKCWSCCKGPKIDFPLSSTYGVHFSASAQRRGSFIAVRHQGSELSYNELNSRANRLARYLQSLGVGPEVLVAVCMERSLDLMVALLGILKSGGAYLPLDPAYPVERLEYMLADSRARILLTEQRLRPMLPGEVAQLICLDNPEHQDAINQQPVTAPPSEASADTLAYVIYTSGSTGAPKGVQVTHRSLLNHNFAISHAYGLQPGERVLQFTPLSFDISVEEIFPTWLNGGTVVLRPQEIIGSPERFLAYTEQEKISVLNLPTAYWHEIVEHLVRAKVKLPSCVRLVVIGGERAAEHDYQRWLTVSGGGVRLINGYGATEATVTSTVHIANGEAAALPIGRPLPNTEIALLDSSMRPVPFGSQGELFIGGAGVARGYLNRPELTAQRFVRNPVPHELDSERLYRTGDQARFRTDGTLEFLGRLDEQVKIRGYRIELGELEAILSAHPGVREAVVVAREDTPGEKRLVAYYVPRRSAPANLEELMGYLRRKVPDYMVPSGFVVMTALPMTPAGKVDRRALPAPSQYRPLLKESFAPPETLVETALAKLWSEVLGIHPIGIHDNFFDLGGHSLVAMQLIERIRGAFQVDVSLEQFFSRPTVADLARYLAEFGARVSPALMANGIAADKRRLPLSPRQQRLWLLEQFHTRRSPYNRPVALRLLGAIEVPHLIEAIRDLARRHEGLRAVFPMSTSEPRQWLCEPEEIQLPTIDLENVPERDRERAARDRLEAEARRPYINSHPVLRPWLFRITDAEHWLLLVLHEIAVDSRSAEHIVQELGECYAARTQGRRLKVEPDQPSYEKLLVRESDLGQEAEADWSYWQQKLKDAPTLLELPADRPRTVLRSCEGRRHCVELGKGLTEQLDLFSQQRGCSLPDVLLGGFAALLHRYTNATDFVVGTLAPPNVEAEYAGVVANLERPVAIRCDVSGEPSFDEFIRRQSQATSEAFGHTRLPFVELVNRLSPERNPGYSRLFQTFFALEEHPVPRGLAGDVELVPLEIDNRTCKLALILRLTRTERGLEGFLEYSTSLFDEDRIERLIEHFKLLLESAMANPGQKVSRLAMMPPAELERVLFEWNETGKPYPKDKTLVDLFLEQVQRTPDAEALVCGTERLRYRDLHAYSAQIAWQLREMHVRPGDLVGICLERTPQLVGAILGTLMAGAAYVPLDPAYPPQRLGLILQDCSAAVLITDSSLRGLLPATQLQVLELDRVNLSAKELPSAAVHYVESSTSLAYVIYTSGSTGTPKGVALEHRNAVAFVHWAYDVFSAEELAGVLASTSICFDLSIFELFVPLTRGGKVILVENALGLPSAPAAHEVTLINTVPSAIRELLRLKAIPASVQVVNLAGEPLATSLVDQLYHETSVAKVYDLYGPTETTTYSTMTLRQAGAQATIGRPLTNEQVYILDKHFQPSPIGVPGELFIGGAGVARGYLNRPELTAQKFIANPFKEGARLYRTGDLARWRADGQLEYLGRLDHQVKIRGFRVELGEIEAVLRMHPSVSEALVIAREDQPGDKRLVAYIVSPSAKCPSAQELRKLVKARLPEHMVPSAVVFLETLPLTPNGKLDRKALPAPEQDAGSLGEFVAPRTPVEEQVAKIWCEVLGCKNVGVKDNFFELGGHSLLATQVVSRLRETFQVQTPLLAFYAAPTVEALAEALISGKWSKESTPLLARRGDNAAHELPLSFVQERLWFLDQLQPGSPAYNVPAGLRLLGPIDTQALESALNRVIERHEALRTTFHSNSGVPSQRIHPELKVNFTCRTFEGLAPDCAQDEARQWCEGQAREPFDLEKGPLIRAVLARLSATEHLFVIVLHHAISDGWSLAVLFHELGVLYSGVTALQPPALPELSVQYPDFADWQRRWMQGALLERELQYWKGMLAGAPVKIKLPADFAPTEKLSGKAERITTVLDRTLTQELIGLGNREGCTQFMLLLAGLGVLLQQWTKQADLVIGTVVAGRNRRELEPVIGCFMNFIPLRLKLQEEHTVLNLLRQTRATVLDGQTHQDCPFEKIVEAVNPQRQLHGNPLYNVALLVQNFPSEPFRANGVQATTVDVPLGAALLDLRFEADQTPEGLRLICEYRPELFKADTVELLLKAYVGVLEKMVKRPSARIADLQVGALSRSDQETAPATPVSQSEVETLTITATFTADPLREPLEHWVNELSLPARVVFSPYNQVFQQLLDPAGSMLTNAKGMNALLLRLEDWLPGTSEHSAGDPDNVRRSVKEFVSAIKSAAARTAVPFLVCVCPASKLSMGSSANEQLFTEQENYLATELAGAGGIFLLTSAELRAWYPVDDYDDPSGNELGHIPYTPVFFTALATAIARKFHALKRRPVKVIVLDCDQTLWDGVCGEDGPLGVKLGAPRQMLQQFMLSQQQTGKLLCLCSKNAEEDVLEVFSKRGEMPLKLEHLAARRLNWLPKSENLKSLSAELQLGLDSFVFLDDNPVECAEVEANCPEVLTLQLPEDPEQLPRFLRHCWVFDTLKVTTEDRRRGELYRQNQQREKLRAEAPSLKEFLNGLELRIEVSPMAGVDLARVSQLTLRTNQFNCSGLRLSEGEVSKQASEGLVLVVRVGDRFGDYGLSGVMVCHAGARALDVRAFLLSCRVLGRGVEHRMLRRLGEIARERGLAWVDIHFVGSARNKPALEFLESVGANYKQALNGGYVFRFPTEFAASVEFHPTEAQGALRGTRASAEPGERLRAPLGLPKFEQCRRVALECHDAATIHRAIEAKLSRTARSLHSGSRAGTELEQKLIELWESLLHLDKVGLDDDFFQLGGHSLLAVRLFAGIEKLVHKKFPLVTIFQAPTIRQLAQVLSKGESVSPDKSLLVPIKAEGSKPPLFLVHGAGGDVLWGYANLAAHLPEDQPVYGIKSRGQLGLEEFTSLEAMAAGYLAIIREFQPEGPYYLGGYCFGGNVAYEMARQLKAQGGTVGLVALLDSAPSNAGYEKVKWWRPAFPARFARNFYFWAKDFAALQSRDRRRFLARKVRALLRRLGPTPKAGQPLVDLEEVIDPAHFPEKELRLWQIHLDALVAHVERHYDGKIILLRTAGQPLLCSLEEDFCWGRLARAGVQVTRLPGSHENIFIEPHVRALAAELTAILEQAQTQQAKRNP